MKRAEPVNTVCVMVVFPSLGNELQMRSFLESLDSEHSSSATSVKVKVPAMLIDAISFEESAATLTLTWSKNTRKVQVQGPLTMLDRAEEQVERVSLIGGQSGRVNLPSLWFMVHEFGANEKTLEDIDVKAATVPDETPV